MNSLVVYDALDGHTAVLAAVIAQTLRRFGLASAVPLSAVNLHQLQDLDLLVLGCATQRRRPTPAMLAFLDRMPPQAWGGLDVACFDTRFPLPRYLTGSAAHALVRPIRQLGALLLGAPESFFVTDREGSLAAGEIERATAWARALHNRIEVRNPLTHPM